MNDAYSEVFESVSKVLIVAGHPDDMEIMCGGLAARLAKDGKQLRLVVTTNGGKGMKDKKGLEETSFGEARVNEQLSAGEILGITKDQNFNLNIPDGELDVTFENIGKIVRHIREFKPELIITHNSTPGIITFDKSSHWVNHKDHRNTGQIVLDAIYPYSRDRGFFTEQFGEGLDTHSVHKLLISDGYNLPECIYFDVTKFVEPKKEALSKHVSAFSPEAVDSLIDEIKTDNGYYEPLAYYELY